MMMEIARKRRSLSGILLSGTGYRKGRDKGKWHTSSERNSSSKIDSIRANTYRYRRITPIEIKD
jgi:hypothetical protein